MPIYEYQCVDCSVKDYRVADLDDRFAICSGWKNPMCNLKNWFSETPGPVSTFLLLIIAFLALSAFLNWFCASYWSLP